LIFKPPAFFLSPAPRQAPDSYIMPRPKREAIERKKQPDWGQMGPTPSKWLTFKNKRSILKPILTLNRLFPDQNRHRLRITAKSLAWNQCESFLIRKTG
jgi:hypothetical protein